MNGDKADAGLGILPAAKAMGLDFIPLFSEEYDLVIPVEYYDSDLLGPMMDLVRTSEFQREVEALGGYDVTKMGTLKMTIGGERH